MKMDIFAVWEEQGNVKNPFVQKEKWLGKKGEARVSDGGAWEWFEAWAERKWCWGYQKRGQCRGKFLKCSSIQAVSVDRISKKTGLFHLHFVLTHIILESLENTVFRKKKKYCLDQMILEFTGHCIKWRSKTQKRRAKQVYLLLIPMQMSSLLGWLGQIISYTWPYCAVFVRGDKIVCFEQTL